MADFTALVTHDPDNPDVATLRLSGDVDVACHDEVVAVGKRALKRCTTLHVDLSDVTFLDSTGLSALIILIAEAELAEASIEFHKPTPRISRLFEIAGIADVLTEAHPRPPS